MPGAFTIPATILGGLAMGAVVYHFVVRSWITRWGATAAELQQKLPGDDLVADAREQLTYAVTINAPAVAVWPWLVQLCMDSDAISWPPQPGIAVCHNTYGACIRSAKRTDPRNRGSFKAYEQGDEKNDDGNANQTSLSNRFLGSSSGVYWCCWVYPQRLSPGLQCGWPIAGLDH